MGTLFIGLLPTINQNKTCNYILLIVSNKEAFIKLNKLFFKFSFLCLFFRTAGKDNFQQKDFKNTQKYEIAVTSYNSQLHLFYSILTDVT